MKNINVLLYLGTARATGNGGTAGRNRSKGEKLCSHIRCTDVHKILNPASLHTHPLKCIFSIINATEGSSRKGWGARSSWRVRREGEV